MKNPFISSCPFVLSAGLLLTGFTLLTPVRAGSLPDLVIPNTCGMQLKGDYSTTSDLDQIKDVGVKMVRRGFHWEGIEKVKGAYDFTETDAIMQDIRQHGFRVLGVLAFGNKLYGPVYNTDDGREAYAKYAAALADRYKADNVIWEIWNEPNTMTFWGKHGKNKGNSDDYATEYVNLVKATVPAMRQADPNCTIVAGSVSCLWSESYKWTEFCFEKGILQTGIDGWSIHPYSIKRPEDYPAAYDVVRDMMAKNGAARDFPILDTERGFPITKAEGYAGGDPAMVLQYQAWSLVRQFLADFTYGVHLTSWYEWKGKEFGIDKNNTLNPAGVAYKILIAQLNGCKFDKRLETQSPLDFVMSFTGPGGEQKLVAWTTPPVNGGPDKAVPHSIDVPVTTTGSLDLVQIDGAKSSVTVNNGTITLALTGAPQYITLQAGK